MEHEDARMITIEMCNLSVAVHHMSETLQEMLVFMRDAERQRMKDLTYTVKHILEAISTHADTTKPTRHYQSGLERNR